jgi:YegS/Rv2252/BmrU family lipid kinase
MLFTHKQFLPFSHFHANISNIFYFCIEIHLKMNRSKIAFIINPNSGTNKKEDLPDLINKTLHKERFDPTIIFTEYAGHGRKLTRQFIEEGYKYIVACGGDGTMNEVASELVHTNVIFGIIPYGSGNGLARHLRISMSPKRALQQINKHMIKTIDYGVADEFKFFCTCGTGFDAHVSHKFAVQGKRGFITYLKTIFKEYLNYKPHLYTLRTGKFEIKQRAFLITFANASQYGNNAFIAPHASISDGMLDITILKPFSFFSIPWLAFLLFRKEIDRSKQISIIRTNEVTLIRQKEGSFHIDGDPVEKGRNIHIKIIPKGLKVLVGRNIEIDVMIRSRFIYARRKIRSQHKKIQRLLFTQENITK